MWISTFAFVMFWLIVAMQSAAIFVIVLSMFPPRLNNIRKKTNKEGGKNA